MPKHLHTLRKLNQQFLCKDPACQWRDGCDYVVGKLVLCPFCNEEFVLTWKQARLVNPWCGICAKGVNSTAERLAEEILEQSIEAEHEDPAI